MSPLVDNALRHWYFYGPVAVGTLALVAPALPGLWRQRGKILAIAGLSVRESLRKKALIAAFAAALVILAATPFVSSLNEPGDKLRVVLTVCVVAINVFGCLVAIVLGAFSLPNDLSDKTVYSVVTKPVRREALIVGKVLGQSAVVLLSLVVVGGVSYIAVQHAALQEDDAAVAAQLLSGRRYVTGDKMAALGKSKMRTNRVGYYWVEGQKGMLEWAFSGLHKRRMPEPTIVATLDGMISPRDPSKDFIPILVTVSNPVTGESRDLEGLRLQEGVPTSFRFASSLISETGELRVTAAAAREGEWLAMKQPGLRLEAVPGGHLGNFVRAMAKLACQFVLIVAISVAGSTFLSAHVSALFSVFVVFCGYINDFIRDLAAAAFVATPAPHLHAGQAPAAPDFLTILINNALREFLTMFSAVAPDFREFAVGAHLVGGLYVSPAALATACGYMLVYALVAFAVARAVMLGKELA